MVWWGDRKLFVGVACAHSSYTNSTATRSHPMYLIIFFGSGMKEFELSELCRLSQNLNVSSSVFRCEHSSSCSEGGQNSRNHSLTYSARQHRENINLSYFHLCFLSKKPIFGILRYSVVHFMKIWRSYLVHDPFRDRSQDFPQTWL